MTDAEMRQSRIDAARRQLDLDMKRLLDEYAREVDFWTHCVIHRRDDGEYDGAARDYTARLSELRSARAGAGGEGL